MTKPAEGEVELMRVSGQINAEPVIAALRANGIPARIQGEAYGVLCGFTLDGLGEVAIFVPAELAGQARELLAAAESHQLELREDEDAGEVGSGKPE